MQAMILAAGFGTRLLPHTEVRPKPLFPIVNTPLLHLTISRLKNAGFDRIIVNCHHLRNQIVESLAGISGVIIQEEEIILGTGGGLRMALSNFRDEPLLVTNGDIYHTIDFKQLYVRHLETSAKITLALHDYPRFNSVITGENEESGKVLGFNKQKSSNVLAFTGIHVIDPAILQPIDNNSFSCIIDHYRALLKAGVSINQERVDDCFWTDMGTPEDYLDLHRGLLKGHIPIWSELGEVKGPFYVSGGEEMHTGCTFEDWVCIGKAQLGHSARISGSVIWDGVEVAGGQAVKNQLISANI